MTRKCLPRAAQNGVCREVMGLLAVLLCLALTLAAPCLFAGGKKKDKKAGEETHLSKAFKGRLPITELSEDQAILHALNRLAYGPRPGDVERIRQMGLEKWIDQQLDPDSINDAALDARLAKYPTLKMSQQELIDNLPNAQVAAQREGISQQEYRQREQEQQRQRMRQLRESGMADPAQILLARQQGPQRILAELAMAKITQATYSQRQLDDVMANFWFNHFNVYAGKGADKWLLTSYMRDTIRPHAMGKFSDLLTATAKSPAMLFYLDNWLSADPVAAQQMRTGLAARRRRFEGLFNNGRPFPVRPGPATAGEAGLGVARGVGRGQQAKAPQKKLERGLNENYGRELMELHTLGVDGGYTQADVIQVAKCFTGWTIRAPRENPEFFFDNRIHTEGAKTVLGKKINAGGMKDGEEVLDLLARSPSTARFISKELARHFVSDDPPPSLVDEMSRTFLEKDGDIRSVLRAMIYSPEFWSLKAYRSKIKTPFELVVSTARALGADVDIAIPLVQWIARMGEPLYLCEPPTGYSDKAEAWVSTGALLNRLNFALALAGNQMPGTLVDLNQLIGHDAETNPQIALTRSLDSFLDGQVTDQTRETLEKRLDDPQILRAKLDDPVRQVNVGLIAGLVLGSPEFQRR